MCIQIEYLHRIRGRHWAGLTATDPRSTWSQMTEAGTLTGMRFLFFIYRIFGRGFFSLIMYPVALYFVLFRSEQRQASAQYLQAHYEQAPEFWRKKPTIKHTLLHFQSFAEVILDKLLGWLIEIDESDFILRNPDLVRSLLDSDQGQLIIGSHFGNLEFCRGFMHRYKEKVINVLLYDKHAGNFVKIMQKESQDSRMNVFQVDEFDVATILMLKEKVDAGEWVFIAGDRIPLSGLERTVDVEFLGKTAPLPIGPYMLAKALSCPIKLMFAYRDKQQSNKVVFDVSPLADKLVLSRKDKMNDLRQYAQLFASKLEENCLKAPYQWFNFYDFWHPESYQQQMSQTQIKAQAQRKIET